MLCGRLYNRVAAGEWAARQHVCPQPPHDLPIGTRVLGRTQLLRCELTAHSSDRGPGSKDKSELTGQLRTDGMTSTPDISAANMQRSKRNFSRLGATSSQNKLPGKKVLESLRISVSQAEPGAPHLPRALPPQSHRSESQPWAAFSCFSH